MEIVRCPYEREARLIQRQGPSDSGTDKGEKSGKRRIMMGRKTRESSRMRERRVKMMMKSSFDWKKNWPIK